MATAITARTGKPRPLLRIFNVFKLYSQNHRHRYLIQLFQLRLSPEQSGKVEYERERLLGIANKSIHLLANPSSLSRSYSTFPLCSGTTLIEISVYTR